MKCENQLLQNSGKIAGTLLQTSMCEQHNSLF